MGERQCLFLGVVNKIFGGKEWGDVHVAPFMAEQCLVFYRREGARGTGGERALPSACSPSRRDC